MTPAEHALVRVLRELSGADVPYEDQVRMRTGLTAEAFSEAVQSLAAAGTIARRSAPLGTVLYLTELWSVSAAAVERVMGVYAGSSGEATRQLYEELEARGPIGIIATNLFRAQKNSARAKVYRGGGYRGKAYDRKQWAMDNLAEALNHHAGKLGIAWGWGVDEDQARHNVVLYVDLPEGQVSFHTARRGQGPDYPGAWDGERLVGATRVCRFAASVLERPVITVARAPGGT